MLLGQLTLPGTYEAFLQHQIWREALEWIRQLPPNPAPGIRQLRGMNMYADVHGYETQPRAQRRYEAHRRYVDLQFGLAGGELIEWARLDTLAPSDEYNPTKDVTHYHAGPVPGASLRLLPGTFAIFFPEDGHMPKVHDGENARVQKLVIKIDRNLLGPI